eukprot:GEMP01017805.1.p1 GENE.GEMP01017805.1~~GEMP01017805.1.p1  ORF type:complete len:551 (+),score=149.73 GEMP01017805.1:560-2212(+)
MSRTINLRRLPDEINDSCYTSEKYPLFVDPTGQAYNFLKYRARCLSSFFRGQLEHESLRKGLTQCMHTGSWLCIDLDVVDVDIESLVDAAHFPKEVFEGPMALFREEVYNALPRPEDNFAGKVTYEQSGAEAVGQFQDRTVAFAPEKCLDVDKRFDPKDSFRLIVTTKKQPPEYLVGKMEIMVVEVGGSTGDGTWAGGEAPKESKSKEQIKLDKDFLDCCFEGEVEEATKLLEKGADSNALDGRGCTGLSEAACAGQLEMIQLLLEHNPPLGSNPNAFGADGRTALHRAAFGSHSKVVELLLKAGADPRTKDNNGETPFDIATHEEVHQTFNEWKIEETDRLLEERKEAVAKAEEALVKDDQELAQLRKRRKVEELFKLTQDGDQEQLELELMDLTPAQVNSYRDDRGNSVLHMAAWNARLEICELLMDEYALKVDVRDQKGWTPLQLASFYGHKKIITFLLSRGADRELRNAYNKNAIDLSKDVEVKEVVMGESVSTVAAPPPAETDAASPKAKAKADGKAKAKAAVAPASAKAKPAAAKTKAERGKHK